LPAGGGAACGIADRSASDAETDLDSSRLSLALARSIRLTSEAPRLCSPIISESKTSSRSDVARKSFSLPSKVSVSSHTGLRSLLIVFVFCSCPPTRTTTYGSDLPLCRKPVSPASSPTARFTVTWKIPRSSGAAPSVSSMYFAKTWLRSILSVLTFRAVLAALVPPADRSDAALGLAALPGEATAAFLGFASHVTSNSTVPWVDSTREKPTFDAFVRPSSFTDRSPRGSSPKASTSNALSSTPPTKSPSLPGNSNFSSHTGSSVALITELFFDCPPTMILMYGSDLPLCRKPVSDASSPVARLRCTVRMPSSARILDSGRAGSSEKEEARFVLSPFLGDMSPFGLFFLRGLFVFFVVRTRVGVAFSRTVSIARGVTVAGMSMSAYTGFVSVRSHATENSRVPCGSCWSKSTALTLFSAMRGTSSSTTGW